MNCLRSFQFWGFRKKKSRLEDSSKLPYKARSRSESFFLDNLKNPVVANHPQNQLTNSGALAKRSRLGTGRKLPYNARSRSPLGLQIGLWTVTSLVPSGNVPSIWTSWIISSTPGWTWLCP